MEGSRLSRGELIAIVGGVLLGAGLFLDWYHSSSSLAKLNGQVGVHTFSGWQLHTTMRYLLLAAALAPFILAYIIARGHALSWPRGELTAVVAIAAFGLIAYNGFVTKPGEPRGEIALQYGFFVSLAGTLLMLFGAASRSSKTERKRKPPGTL
ncbi:MAG TPA: hypothetical protein VGN69_05685 [Solirubrobacteraceae bacterium]|jgi:hypothetical protein|nr:hypothetical protein [Solirubrobacteraceae bacterium]